MLSGSGGAYSGWEGAARVAGKALLLRLALSEEAVGRVCANKTSHSALVSGAPPPRAMCGMTNARTPQTRRMRTVKGKIGRKRERARERKKESGRHRDRDKDRETKRDGKKERKKERKTERKKERERKERKEEKQ